MPRFEKAFLADVRARVSLLALVSRRVQLKQRGRGDWWGLSPFIVEKTPSFHVIEKEGYYHCFATGEHGDCFTFYQFAYGCAFPEAVEALAVEVGLLADSGGAKRELVAPVVEARDPAEAVADRQRRSDSARGMWARAAPAAGTLVETYLAARGLDAKRLPLGIPPTLRFLADCWHPFEGRAMPAMIAAVKSPTAKILGVHRTYLAADGAGKARGIGKAKLMAGICGGGAIRLAPAARRMGLAEGIETALSVTLATGLPVWAAGSLNNMAACDMPAVVRDLILCVDGDGHRENLDKMIEKAKAFHAARGCAVYVARPPDGSDFNDMLRAGQPVEGAWA